MRHHEPLYGFDGQSRSERCAFPDGVRQVDIIKMVQADACAQSASGGDDLFIGGPRASDDFMSAGERPALEQHELR